VPGSEVPFWHLCGRTKEDQRISCSGWPVFGLRFEPGTLQIESRNDVQLSMLFRFFFGGGGGGRKALGI
jgi:hypothetical protein